MIGVLMGGSSSEREISLRSGRAVARAFKENGHDVLEIDCIGDVKATLAASGIEKAFIALHGRFGEDGSVQAILEELNIPYTGSGPLPSYLALDKIASRMIFEKEGLRVPRCEVFYKADSPRMPYHIELPVIVKPNTEGSSIGLSIVKSDVEFAQALELARDYDDCVLVEEYIEGRELTVGILGDVALPVVEIKPKSGLFDYDSKYTKGLTEYTVPAEIPIDIANSAKRSAVLAHNALSLSSFSRVDMIWSGTAMYILEVNTIPGMTETSLLPKAALACGISFNDLCERLLQMASLRIRDVEKTPKELPTV